MRSAEEILQRHFEASEEQDVDAALEDYADDAVLISNGEIFRGHDELRAHFEELFSQMAGSESEFTMNQQIIEDDCIYFTYELDTPEISLEFATDTMVIQDGAIVVHTVAGKPAPSD